MQYMPCYSPSLALCEHRAINSLYVSARNRARWGQLWSALIGRSDHLLALAEIEAVGPLSAHRYAGMQTVPIRHIRGSLDRVHDFDLDFCPLQDHNKDRWLSVAAARISGKYLPPVQLIQVGQVYFVQDGHHRISVAQALGQKDIEAQVTVWQVTASLPWEMLQPVSSSAYVGQPLGSERVLGRLPCQAAQLVGRVAQKIHKLVGAVRATLSDSLSTTVC